MKIISQKITLRVCLLLLSVLALTLTLISCPPTDDSAASSSSGESCNEDSTTITEVSQDVGLHHILLTLKTEESSDCSSVVVGFAVNTSATPIAKANISGKYGYITRKFTKGVNRQVYLAVKTDVSSNTTLVYADDALTPNTQYYVHLYYGTKTKTISFSTPNYPTADPGHVFTLSPPANMVYEVKIDEPIILTYFFKFVEPLYIHYTSTNSAACSDTLGCSPKNAYSNQMFFDSGIGTPTLANNMGYATLLITGKDESRFGTATGGTFKFTRNATDINNDGDKVDANEPAIERSLTYKVVTE